MQFKKIKLKCIDVHAKMFGVGVILKDTDELSNVLLNPISDKLYFGKNIYESIESNYWQVIQTTGQSLLLL